MISILSEGNFTCEDFYSPLPATSRLFTLNLLSWDSATSARSSASSSSCCAFRNLAKWTLVCSSCVSQSNSKRGYLNSFQLAAFLTVIKDFLSPPPHTAAYTLSLWAAACWPDPAASLHSSSPPHPKMKHYRSSSHISLNVLWNSLCYVRELLPDTWAL